MQIVKLTFDMPYHPYGEPETPAKKEADLETLRMDLDRFGVVPNADYPNTAHTDSEKAVKVMCYFSKRLHTQTRLNGLEEVYDGKAAVIEDLNNILTRLQIAASKVEAQTAAGWGERPDGPGWNAHTNSPISGPLLHSFNELRLLENICTDELQNALDDGWRIIAVCPQESRRPDYVLARSNNLRVTGSSGALR